jgi:hypothetical protein
MNRQFESGKRSQLFIRVHNVTLFVVAVSTRAISKSGERGGTKSRHAMKRDG